VGRAVNTAPTHSHPGRLARRFTVATAAYGQRRRIATVFAVVIAVLLGYHALFGANGVVAYRAKRSEDRVLAQQLEKMKLENGRLKSHVEHLKTDPDAIEYEAHMRLRYTRPDQVIVLNNTANPATPVPNPATPTPNPAAPTPNTAAPASNAGTPADGTKTSR
jgi:cell division protein FtsB